MNAAIRPWIHLDPRGKWCGVETRQQVVNPGDYPYFKSVYAAREGSEPLIEKYLIQGFGRERRGLGGQSA